MIGYDPPPQPSHQRRGIGSELLRRLRARYEAFHQQVLIAEGAAAEFYRAHGFVRAAGTVPMWVFAGAEHA